MMYGVLYSPIDDPPISPTTAYQTPSMLFSLTLHISRDQVARVMVCGQGGEGLREEKINPRQKKQRQ
jgi:hypothetical protein